MVKRSSVDQPPVKILEVGLTKRTSEGANSLFKKRLLSFSDPVRVFAVSISDTKSKDHKDISSQLLTEFIDQSREMLVSSFEWEPEKLLFELHTPQEKGPEQIDTLSSNLTLEAVCALISDKSFILIRSANLECVGCIANYRDGEIPLYEVLLLTKSIHESLKEIITDSMTPTQINEILEHNLSQLQKQVTDQTILDEYMVLFNSVSPALNFDLNESWMRNTLELVIQVLRKLEEKKIGKDEFQMAEECLLVLKKIMEMRKF